MLRREPAPREIEAFSLYLTLLRRWNRAYSLTAYRDPLQIIERLFLDSLLFLEFIPPGTQRVLDFGSGVGVPGIPISIVRSEVRMTLIESQRRKVSFLRSAVRELALENVQVVEGRAEAIVKSMPELEDRFEVVVSRAAGTRGAVWAVASRLLKANGRFVASGPPMGKGLGSGGEVGSWAVLTTPSGRQRRFYVVTKVA